MYISNGYSDFSGLFGRRPRAIARLKGSAQYPELYGTVRFYEAPMGVLVVADVRGLPQGQTPCDSRIFGFHIHGGEICTGNVSDPFADVGGHYNPDDCEHPHHAGDLPPLFGVGGNAFSAFLTNRFCIEEIVGKTIIIHDSPDDFTTQPAGNSGNKIACGEIKG